MPILKATSTPAQSIFVTETNPAPELNFDQSVHDTEVWREHHNLANTARSLLLTISAPLDERVHESANPNSPRGKANKAADYASMLGQFLSAVDLPRLHGNFANIFHRHRNDLEPDLIGNIRGLFTNARELLNKLTEKLQQTPIARATSNSDGRWALSEGFYPKLQELGLNVEN